MAENGWRPPLLSEAQAREFIAWAEREYGVKGTVAVFRESLKRAKLALRPLPEPPAPPADASGRG